MESRTLLNSVVMADYTHGSATAANHTHDVDFNAGKYHNSNLNDGQGKGLNNSDRVFNTGADDSYTAGHTV